MLSKHNALNVLTSERLRSTGSSAAEERRTAAAGTPGANQCSEGAGPRERCQGQRWKNRNSLMTAIAVNHSHQSRSPSPAGSAFFCCQSFNPQRQVSNAGQRSHAPPFVLVLDARRSTLMSKASGARLWAKRLGAKRGCRRQGRRGATAIGEQWRRVRRCRSNHLGTTMSSTRIAVLDR